VTTPTPVPSLPAVLTASQERTWALVAHLSVIVVWIVGPLLVWLSGKDRSPFVDHQGKEALNFSIDVSIAYVVGFVVTFGAFAEWWLAVVGIAILGLAGLTSIILPFLGAAAAYRGELFHYPFALRFIR
jgi:uncharacterized protein